MTTDSGEEVETAPPGESGSTETGWDRPEGVPVWEDQYLDSVARRLLHHYDLERDYVVDGERFDLYGHLEVRHERHALHPSLTFAYHETEEHLFATRVDRPTLADIERFEALGERLAAEWIDADENHYSTDITFAIVADELTEDARRYIKSYRNRTLLRKGYYGHYELNLLVVVPDREESVASEQADAEQAFRIWEPIVKESPGPLSRLINWLSR